MGSVYSDKDGNHCSQCGANLGRSGSCSACKQNEILKETADREANDREADRQHAAKLKESEIRAMREVEEHRISEKRNDDAVRTLKEHHRSIFADLIIVVKTQDLGLTHLTINEYLSVNDDINELITNDFEQGEDFYSEFLSSFKVDMANYVIANPNDAGKLKILREALNTYASDLNQKMESKKQLALELQRKEAEAKAELQRKEAEEKEKSELQRKEAEEKEKSESQRKEALRIQAQLNIFETRYKLTAKEKSCSSCNYLGVMATLPNKDLTAQLMKVVLFVLSFLLSLLAVFMMFSKLLFLGLLFIIPVGIFIRMIIKYKNKFICPKCATKF
jgi:uncharacterized membrane protein YdbT with pleckstrin-like domain